MLIYDQTLDPYHCSIRALGISFLLGYKSHELETIRILDIVLTFPAMLSEIRLTRETLHLRKLSIATPNPFRVPPKGSSSIEAIRSIQAVAIATLASAGLISAPELARGKFSRSAMALPNELKTAIEAWLDRDGKDKKEIVTALGAIPLFGEDGLKHRTKLMEHRYDHV